MFMMEHQEIIKATGGQLAKNLEKEFYAELACYELVPVKSMALAASANTPAIGMLEQKYGHEPIKLYISGHIVALRDFVNLRGSMTDDQTIMTSELILSEYPNITIADITLIFRRAKLGHYGEFYGRLDGQMILWWVMKYFDEKCAYFMEKSIQEANGSGLRIKDAPNRIQKQIDNLIKK